jgi:hypothetical protein
MLIWCRAGGLRDCVLQSDCITTARRMQLNCSKCESLWQQQCQEPRCHACSCTPCYSLDPETLESSSAEHHLCLLAQHNRTRVVVCTLGRASCVTPGRVTPCIISILVSFRLSCGVSFMVHGKRAFVKHPNRGQRRPKPGAAFGPQKTEQKNKRSKLTSVKNQIRAVKRLLAKARFIA